MIAGKVIPWRRFWTPLGSHLSAGHDGRGFMDDPEDELGRSMNPEVHLLTELLNRPLIVLTGQPGIGKTTEVDDISSQASKWLAPDERLISLSGRIITSEEALRRETVESQKWRITLASGGRIRLLFDAVDEALRRVSVLIPALAHWLKDEPRERVNVVLVSRAAEWHLADGQLLATLWGEQASSIVYELCPLRWKDAELAARECSIDPDLFFGELLRHQVKGLAARPITLRLLLEEMRRNGKLPGSHHELFSSSIARLCEEVDEERVRHQLTSRPKPAHIARVAARIAALSMLGGCNVVARHAQESAAGKLEMAEIAVGQETVDGERFQVTPALVAATLDTPLFSFRGADLYGFDHQTFAEHLASDYLRTCTVTQLRRLLCVAFEGIERVAPQLAEVAARVASINTPWCDHLIAVEPEILLRADASPLSDSQRERAIGSLLQRAECEEAFDEAGTGYFYNTFRHPRLADQLRPYIENPTYNLVVRRMAIGIAGDAGVLELEPLLWKRVEARDPAFGSICGALRDLAGVQSHERLLAALYGDLPDEGGQLKDLALTKLVPIPMRVRDVLPYIINSPYENFFFANSLPKHLTVDDLLPVLKVMETGRFAGHDAHGLRELAAKTFEMAMENLHQPEVANALANYWRSCARNHFALPSRILPNDPNPLAVLSNAGKRRALAMLVLTLPGAEADDVDRFEEPLVKKEDAVWLFEQLPLVCPETLPVWVRLCAQSVWVNFPLELDELLRRRYEEFPELRAHLPIPKRFDIATTLRRLRRTHELRIARIQKRNARRFRWRSRNERLARVWEELNSNDTVWVGFCDCAFEHEDSDPKRKGHADHADITDSPAWLLAHDVQKEGLQSAARRFLLTRNDSPRPKNAWSNYAQAACYGIGLLRTTVGSDDDLRAAVSTRWPRVVFDEIDHGSPAQCAAVAAVYRLVPEVGASRLAEKLLQDNRDDGYMIDLRRYVQCWDARLVDVIRDFLFSRGVKPRAIRQIFTFLDEHDNPSALFVFDELLKHRGGYRPLDEYGRALLAVGIFLLRAQRWEDAWTVLGKCSRKAARQAFLDAAHDLVHRDVKFPDHLNTQQLTAVCAGVLRLFPRAEYSERHDVGGHVSSKHMMPDLREGLIAKLVARATAEACAGLLELLQQAPPEQRIWMRWHHREAVKNVLRRNWTTRTRTITDLLAMMRDYRTLTVDTTDDLLDAVLSSLERLQLRLSIAESPELRSLWNEPRDSEPMPKTEEMLSNTVQDWIQRDLGPGGGIVLNREVQATRQNKLDIKIEALCPNGGLPLVLVIEVKGDWHPKVTSALGQQLVKRYLIQNHWTHGIFLVGWYGARNSSRRRIKGWPPADVQKAQELAKTWETTQCPPGLTVRALIIDCSFPSKISEEK